MFPSSSRGQEGRRPQSSTPMRTKILGHDQVLTKQTKSNDQQQDLVDENNKKQPSRQKSGLKVKSHLSACDVQRRKEHMHRLTSGIAITDRKVLNADMWTPGTDAYRQRFYENHQLQQPDTTPNISTILGETEPRNAFTHRKTLGLDKMARCKICEIEFLATNLTTTVTFKRIFDLRAKWKSAAAEAVHEGEEKKHEHEVAEQIAKDRAALLVTTAKKAAEVAAKGATTFTDDDDDDTQECEEKEEQPLAIPLKTTPVPPLPSSLSTEPKRTTNHQQRSLSPINNSEATATFTSSVLYAPCRICRFCSQFVGAYLDDQSPSAAAPIVRHKAFLPPRNAQQRSSGTFNKPTESPTQTLSQNKNLFPSSAQPILQICLQKRRAAKKDAVTPLQRSCGDEVAVLLSTNSMSGAQAGSPVSLIRSRPSPQRHTPIKKDISATRRPRK